MPTPTPQTADTTKAASPVKVLSAPQRAMRKLGLVRDIDLALHLPLRYEDETQLQPIAHTRDGQTAQVEGVVREAQVELRSRRQLVVRLTDDSGELTLRFLNFYPSHQKVLARGQRVRVRGEVRGGFLGREMVHPMFKAVEPGAPLPAALTPVYPSSAQLPQVYLRKAVTSALARAPLDEVLPPACVPAGLPALKEAVRLLHQPPPGLPLATLDDRSHPAWQRLKFDELLAQQLAQAQAVAARERLRAPVMSAAASPSSLHARLRASLPFALTAAQARVCAEIDADLARPVPMHRLLQGDVGSGKTVVAALAAARAIDTGWQCALMAPTEILAEQHFHKLVHWLQPLGITVAWLTGSRKGKVRRLMLEQIASGQAGLVVGTHAVIQDDVVFARLGLAVVDEQHRFGVAQRLELRHKLVEAAGTPRLEPHLLTMSATPIPRTLAMTYFADLAVSTIDELPPGRTPIVTKVFADSKREQVIGRIRDEVDKGRQVYWVCPLIEESESLDLQNATETHAQLSAVLAAALPGCQVGLLHGRMPAAEKAAVMAEFSSGRMGVLVATTVIEVGVDVPNASLMVIEHAERFGLAQLHQLRGRVGRGAAASVCVLLYTGPLSDTGKARLKAMAETTDGFEIARRDLQIRGPGEFMGARQSGADLLRFADLNGDTGLLAQARRVAPRLMAEHPAAARAHVARWLSTKAEYLKA
ncbi:MAG: ATP-dependent DNA helicase RecG [Betaproteobacteria bacterium]